MKIAVVAPTYLPSNRANTIQVMKMTQALMENGNEVRLAVPAGRASIVSHRWEHLAHRYGLHQEFEIEWLVSSPVWRGYDFGWRAMQWAKGWGAHYVFTRHPQTAAFCSQNGIPTILEIHDIPHGWGGGMLFKGFLNGKGRRRLVVITQALADDLASSFSALAPFVSAHAEGPVAKASRIYSPGFVFIAPDGVDLVRYAGLPAPHAARVALAQIRSSSRVDLPADKFTAGYTGHLYAGRGTGLLLDLAQRLPQITFMVAGGEPAQVEALRGEAEKRGLKNMYITGFIPNAELPLVQAACDVLLMPYQERVAASSGGDISRYLSPMKAFEYLACGRPIVVSDLPVFGEIFDDNNSVRIVHSDVDEWAQALVTLQNDPRLCKKLTEHARLDVQQYEWKGRAARILEGLAETDEKAD